MIIVDESDPIEELEPTFPYRDVNIRRDTSIREDYEMLEEIGRGKFGRVYRCRDKASGLMLAAKVVTTMKKDERLNVEREIEIMKTLQHPRLIQLYDAIEDVNRAETCLVLEMVVGGELFDRVIQDEFVLTERACAVFVRQICEAIEYIHSKGILHLDMKPENVMCLSKNGNRIKIIDFGLARFYDPAKKLQVLFGTPEFTAPEVVNFDAISFATDLWSVGVITYVLLSGLSPFMGDTDVETMANVTIGKFDFDDESFDDISEDALDFIAKLLTKDKKKRLLATDCLKHRWLKPMPTKNSVVSSPSKKCSNESKPIHVELNIDIGTAINNDEGEISSSCFNSNSKRLGSGSGSGSSSNLSISSSSSLSPSTSSISPPPPLPSVITHPCIFLGTNSEKRASLDLTKDHLKTFVSRWTDKPYIFDSPRGIISPIYDNSPQSRDVRFISRRSAINNSTHGNSLDCGVNIAGQIRRFSYQLHEDLQIMKTHTQCVGVDSLRKCSWGEVSVNAQ